MQGGKQKCLLAIVRWSETSKKVTDLSEMPCHLIGDVHEGLTRSLLSLGGTSRIFRSGEQARDFRWEMKTP